ncbi:hypothetical protein J4407_01570 [Candidatus Pacearchaeota archaeon]|nr:hypothetical protein [Candidatus Pacearchaeota archaeon]
MKRGSQVNSFLPNISEKKGLSGIVVTLILIVIVMSATLLIWFVVRDILGEGTENINVGAKCLDVNIEVAQLTCTGVSSDVCTVSLTRNAGGDNIGGVKVVFSNETATKTYVHDAPGNIAPLETKTVSAIATGIKNADKAEPVVYFLDASGNEQLCSALL